MAEITTTGPYEVFSLPRPTGHGLHGMVGYFQIDDTETFNSGFSVIIGVFTCEVEDRAADTPICNPTSKPTTGTVTLSVGALDDNAADAGSYHYLLIFGEMHSGGA